MEAADLVAKRPYQRHPTRYAYELTARGAGLQPVLQEICIWANGAWPNTWKPPPSFMVRDRVT